MNAGLVGPHPDALPKGEAGAAKRIAVVGGGLAGLAAAAALSGRGFEIELFEARRQLGGRAGSFRDPASGAWVDHCQHVSMGCCTNLADFCRRTGIADAFRRDAQLHFFGPDGRQYAFAASRWLPPPLHLGPAFMRLGYLTLGERWAVAHVLWKLARTSAADDERQPTIGQWLRQHGQSAAAIERFWAVVLVSALGEEVERASLAAARKVFIDGFMSAREAYEIEVPQIPLGELYGRRLETWLAGRGVKVSLGVAVEQVEGDASRACGVVLADGSHRPFDAVVVAVPWRRVREVFSEPILSALPELAGVEQIEAAPITGIHLWFDREITSLPHAVLVGKLSQWIFNRGRRPTGEGGPPGGHYYQVVISASRNLAGRDRDDVLAEIVAELGSIWPAAQAASLLQARIVTEQAAVFSLRPGIERLRPSQQTPIANLALAGDWTRTGWPATMEGAVRSGYLAAEAILKSFGRSETLLVSDLPRGWLAKRML
ncbi:MAG TPA: hydroxysqualene dehydroxylase HpnE [Pirellulales bacterium]|nr:hydroxysqualene dehydroxylase HpnE [Pirellulales bacterium]